MRFDREMDSKLHSKPARESSIPRGRRTVQFAVHLMTISNITRLDIAEVTQRPDRVWMPADDASPTARVDWRLSRSGIDPGHPPLLYA